jgi:hypothetical protein
MPPTLANGKTCDAPEITARFRDLGGNVIGLYQEPGRAAQSSSEAK